MRKAALQAALARAPWPLGLSPPDAHGTDGGEMAVNNSYLAPLLSEH